MHHWPVMYSCMVKEPSWYREKGDGDGDGKGGKIILLVATLCRRRPCKKNVKPSYLGLTCKIRDFITKTQQRLSGFVVLLFRCYDFRHSSEQAGVR